MNLPPLGEPGYCRCGRRMEIFSGDYKWWGCGKCNALKHDCQCSQVSTCRFGSPLESNQECIDTYMGCHHRKK